MTQRDYVKVYNDLLKKIKDVLSVQIPKLNENEEAIFRASCSTVQACKAARDSAEAARNAIPDGDDKKDAANEVLKQCEEALTNAIEVGNKASRPILQNVESKLDHIDPTMLSQSAILTHGTPDQLGAFANQSEQNAALINELLADAALMDMMLKAAGANGGCYGQAMQIYKSILASSDQIQHYDILQKLALGTALEHSVPMAEFDTPDIKVDPVKRYKHYEEAFLTGALDPSFPSRTVWECRLVVDSDAPDEQLGWCREMLRNYRPDEVLETDMVWRYCRSVRTEVGYRKPSWTASPRTYQQLISGGGECGPRAWFGRFSCKSFGIPTWGVRQPGHAAMTHWTPTGWVVCLGADWPYCTWDDRCGPDFHLEAQARNDEDEYFKTVLRIEFLANLLQEGPLDPSSGLVNPDCLWRSLALMQKVFLSSQDHPPSLCSSPLDSINKISLARCNDDEQVCISDSKIIVPASICKSSDQITCMLSFLGGNQIHIREEATLEYTLSEIPAGSYDLTMRICNVHLKQDPLLFYVNNESDSVGIASIDIPYTVGIWKYTKPIMVELTQGTNTLSIIRKNSDFGGLTIKDLTLTPSAESRLLLS